MGDGCLAGEVPLLAAGLQDLSPQALTTSYCLFAGWEGEAFLLANCVVTNVHYGQEMLPLSPPPFNQRTLKNYLLPLGFCEIKAKRSAVRNAAPIPSSPAMITSSISLLLVMAGNGC